MEMKQYQREKEAVLGQIKEVKVWDMRVVGKGPEGEEFSQPLSYFDVNETHKVEDMIDNLFETCYLNPPQEMYLQTPAQSIRIY